MPTAKKKKRAKAPKTIKAPYAVIVVRSKKPLPWISSWAAINFVWMEHGKERIPDITGFTAWDKDAAPKGYLDSALPLNLAQKGRKKGFSFDSLDALKDRMIENWLLDFGSRAKSATWEFGIVFVDDDYRWSLLLL